MSEPNDTPVNGAPPSDLKIGPSTADLVAEMDEFGESDPATAYLAKQAKGEEKPKEKASAEPAAAPDAEGDGETPPADGDEAADEVPDEEADAEVEDEPSDDEPADPPDPVAAKRIEAIQKAEKESKARLAQERQEAERLLQDRHREFESQVKPRIEKAERVEKLLDRARVDPLALASELGWDKDDLLHAAEQLYLEAKGHDDPKYKVQRAERMRARETATKASAFEKELAETKSMISEMRAEQMVEKAVAKATTLISDKTPVLKKMMASNPEFTEGRIRSAIDYIRKQTGETPAVSEVIAKLEEVEAAELRARGIDLPKASPKAKPTGTNGANPKTKTQEAGERKTAKTAVNGNNKSPPPDAPPPTKEQLLKELEALDRN